MKNTLTDLNNHLFAQMERLSDEDLNGEALEQELKRTDAIKNISKEIISNAQLALDAQIAVSEKLPMAAKLPAMLEQKKNA